MKKKIITSFGFMAIAVIGCTYDKGEVAKPQQVLTDCDLVSYNKDIAPFINEYCVSCHNPDFGGYDLTTYSGVKQKVVNGTLRERVLVARDMPVYCPVTTSDAKKLECWLNKGAPDN